MKIPHRISALRLFSVPGVNRPWWKVFLWWEIRRIPYNAIVGAFGLISTTIVYLIADKFSFDLNLGSPALTIVFFGLAANMFYTGGWITELLARVIWSGGARTLGPVLLFYGILFSVFLTFAPVFLITGELLWRARHS